jgi:hypothetical protein
MDTDVQLANTFLACGLIWTNTPAVWSLQAKPWNWVMAEFRGPGLRPFARLADQGR